MFGILATIISAKKGHTTFATIIGIWTAVAWTLALTGASPAFVGPGILFFLISLNMKKPVEGSQMDNISTSSEINRSINPAFDAPICNKPEAEKIRFVCDYLQQVRYSDKNKYFPGGVDQITTVIYSIINLCGIPSNHCSEGFYRTVALSYIDALKVQAPDELRTKYSYFIPTTEIAQQIISFAKRNQNDPAYRILAPLADSPSPTDSIQEFVPAALPSADSENEKQIDFPVSTDKPSSPNSCPVTLPTDTEQMICSNCGKGLHADSVFCCYCGTKVEAPKPAACFCRQCGKKLLENAAFCNYCGTRVM